MMSDVWNGQRRIVHGGNKLFAEEAFGGIGTEHKA